MKERVERSRGWGCSGGVQIAPTREEIALEKIKPTSYLQSERAIYYCMVKKSELRGIKGDAIKIFGRLNL